MKAVVNMFQIYPEYYISKMDCIRMLSTREEYYHIKISCKILSGLCSINITFKFMYIEHFHKAIYEK